MQTQTLNKSNSNSLTSLLAASEEEEDSEEVDAVN